MNLTTTRERIDCLDECRSAAMGLRSALNRLQAAEAHSSLPNPKLEFNEVRNNNGESVLAELLDLVNALGASPEFATLLVQTAAHRVEDLSAKLRTAQLKWDAICQRPTA